MKRNLDFRYLVKLKIIVKVKADYLVNVKVKVNFVVKVKDFVIINFKNQY